MLFYSFLDVLCLFLRLYCLPLDWRVIFYLWLWHFLRFFTACFELELDKNHMCAQQSLVLACASSQSDQSLHCRHKEAFGHLLSIEGQYSNQTAWLRRLILVFRLGALIICSFYNARDHFCYCLIVWTHTSDYKLAFDPFLLIPMMGKVHIKISAVLSAMFSATHTNFNGTSCN